MSKQTQDILGALGSIDFSAKGGDEESGSAAAPVSAARQHMEKKKEKAQEAVMFDLENFSMSSSSSSSSSSGGSANPLDAATSAVQLPNAPGLMGDALRQATSAWARERADFAMGRLASRAAAEDRAAGRSGKQKGKHLSKKASVKKKKAMERGSNYVAAREKSAQDAKRKKRMQKRRTIY